MGFDGTGMELLGRTKEMKQRLVQEFDELTDSDMDEAGDDPDKIVSTIQQRTGQSREAVEQRMREVAQRWMRSDPGKGAEAVLPFSEPALQLRGSATLRTRSQTGRSSGSETRLTRATSRLIDIWPACVTSTAAPSPTSIPATTSLG